jgi:hypothetical protein
MKPSKFTLYPAAKREPFSDYPCFAELKDSEIMVNEEPILPGDYHPHKMRLWVIGHEFGAICAVWANCEQEALDNAVDLDLLDCFLSEDQDYDDEELTGLGNASELFDLSMCWMFPVDFQIERDWELLKAFARAGDNSSLDY